MSDEQGKSSAKIITIVLLVCFAALVVWKFASLREYAYGMLSSEAIVPMPEYHVSDVPKIVEVANADRSAFNQRYFRQTLSGDVVFAGSEGRGASTFLIRTTAPGTGAGSVTISCGMNKFMLAANKDALSSLKSGDIVHIKGPIGSDTGGQAISLGDGCVVEKSYAQPPAAQPPAK